MPGQWKYPLPNPGDRYGRLVVLYTRRRGKHGHWHAACRCDCRRIKFVDWGRLRSGDTTSCGCYHNELARQAATRHGDSGTRLWITWRGMIERCRGSYYPGYGARGIAVCTEWHNYVDFREWALMSGYQDDLEIDRIDVNGNYEPENCRWVTRAAQQRNTRKTVWLTAFGETKCLPEWAEDPRCAVAYDTLLQRVSTLHWDHERALSTPLRQRAAV